MVTKRRARKPSSEHVYFVTIGGTDPQDDFVIKTKGKSAEDVARDVASILTRVQSIISIHRGRAAGKVTASS